jgi:putative holliday junction resolvase
MQTVSDKTSPGRVLALDVGLRRIGLAVSDALGITAQGMPTLQRRNKRSDLAALRGVVAKHEVAEVVVGHPLHLSGKEGRQAEKVVAFADDLREHLGIPVHLWDERLTSAQANRVLRETDMSIRRRSEVVDQMAAVLILQAWLDSRRS